MTQPQHDPAAETIVQPAAHDDATVTADAEANTIAGVGTSTFARIEVGGRLGAYRLERRLGAGGMGEVFAARKGKDGPLVALKVLSDMHATRLYRFKREFRALADVKHENLIALDELVVLPSGQAFFTMELVRGDEFVEWVRGDTPNGQLPNLVRLERALRQLVEGVHHLHLARCVHRDIKPSNVLVTRDGRVVILDFGVISEMNERAEEHLTRDGQMMGTPAYMAPEQAGGQTAGPPADFYALGTMLYECLTGELPFKGSILDILVDKRHGEAPDPSKHLDPGVTRSEQVERLIGLCREALAVDPDERPDIQGFLTGLGAPSTSSLGLGPGPGPSPAASMSMSAGESRVGALVGTDAPFVGRTQELAVLAEAYAKVSGQLEPVTVHVRGNSGQGKSALIARFLRELRRDGEIVTLRGRCLERESVPYKGIDAVVDALAVYMRHLDEVERARLQPRHIAPLLQLFPVLGDAWRDGGRILDLDPGELRRRGLAGLREVLARVGERRPLIVYVDDFQWADVDSARLITELMRPPDPPPMLLIITFRDEVDEREALQMLTAAEAVESRDVRSLAIGPLSEADARALAQALLRERSSDKSPEIAELYARRAQGNPFYIGQMVLGEDPHSSTDVSLDRLVARRIVGLDLVQRQVLAAVSVAGGPTPIAVVLRACGLGATGAETLPNDSQATRPEASAEIDALLAANLMRRSADRDGLVRIEAAHDRIRVVAVGELSPAELRETHLALGEAFERHGGGESEALAEHFALGGDQAKAFEYTRRAARDAAGALAFDRAAQLYRRALTLAPSAEPEARRELEQALAEQLVDLGRGAEAAAMFTELAASAKGPRAARDLRRRAASELVKAGYLDEGMAAIAPVLDELGIWQPRGVLMTILLTLWNRLVLVIRGYKFTRREESEVPPELLERIDTLIATKTGLSHHEAIFAGYQQSRAMRLALRAGEARRLIRGLVHDAAIFVAIGRKARGRELMQIARELVTTVPEPEYHRVIEYVSANHRDHSGDWVGAAAGFEALQARLDESPNSGWIRGASTVQWMWVRKLLGRYALLRAELPERVATARDLGNRHEHITLSTLHYLIAAIYADSAAEIEAERRQLVELRAQWHPRQVTFQHIIMAMTAVELALLAGDAAGALAEAEEVLGDRRARIVAGMMPSHVDMYELRGRSSLRAALDGIDLEASLARARGDLERLRGSHKPQVAAQAVIIEAGVRSCEGEAAAAEAAWRQAAERLESLNLGGHLACVRVRLGDCGDEQAAAQAQAYFEDQGIVAWRRLVDALAPGRTPS